MVEHNFKWKNDGRTPENVNNEDKEMIICR